MAINYNRPQIVTNGLVLCLDAADIQSYGGSGSAWADRSGNGYDGELFNSPTFTSNFRGGITCLETDEFIALDNKVPTDHVSVECWYTRDSSGSGEDIVFNKENCWELKDNGGDLQWAVYTNNQGWFWHNSTADIAVGETVHFVLSYDGNYVRSYKNGQKVQTYTYPSGGVLHAQTSCYPKLNSRHCTRTTIQNSGNHTFYQFRIYDRALTDAEVLQNYNATRGRFGL
jgi:hypothetical protein